MHASISLLFTFLTGVAPAMATPTSSGPGRPVRCQNELTTALAARLPRELKLNERVIDHALSSPADARLLESLARVYTVLTPDKMNAMRHLFRVEPPADRALPTDLVDNEFLRDRPEFDSSLVRGNLGILAGEFERADLTAYDLGVVATLFSVVRREPVVDYLDQQRTAAAHDVIQRRIQAVLDHVAYREVFHALLALPSLRQALLNDWNKVSGPFSKRRKMMDSDFDLIRERLLRQWPTSLDVKYVGSILLSVVNLTFVGVNEWTFHHLPGMFERGFGSGDRIVRRGFLPLLELYFTRVQPLGVPMADLIELFDNVYFGAPLPNEVASMHAQTIEVAKSMLLMLKSAYQREASKSAPAAPVIAAHKLFTAPEVDAPPPLVSRKRPPRVMSNHPLPRSERPVVGVTYDLVFRRNPEKGLQRVVFAPTVVHDLGDGSLRAQLSNALHEGWAWSKDQVGIRVVRPRNRRVPGRVFGIDLGRVTALLMQVDGTWQVLAIAETGAATNELANRVEPLP